MMNQETIKRQGLMLAALALTALAPDLANAAPGGFGVDTALCNIIAAIQGTIGAAIATIAIIVIGMGALMGKVSWGTAIIVLTGIGIIFGASSVVSLVAPSAAACA